MIAGPQRAASVAARSSHTVSTATSAYGGHRIGRRSPLRAPAREAEHRQNDRDEEALDRRHRGDSCAFLYRQTTAAPTSQTHVSAPRRSGTNAGVIAPGIRPPSS